MYFIQFSRSGNGLKNKSEEPDFLAPKNGFKWLKSRFSDTLRGGCVRLSDFFTEKLFTKIDYTIQNKYYILSDCLTFFNKKSLFKEI